jgi:DNA (cytosine-5)-methyltransferase 1
MDASLDVTGALRAQEHGHPSGVAFNSVVRRLTPLECERLQGFPDGWTDIGDWVDSKGKKHRASDSPRYKALGNSIALPFWFWLLRRISAQYERPATLGSLFDGIGGFPLCWERCNGKGTALWASKIEEFPIAVTKIRFSETKGETTC